MYWGGQAEDARDLPKVKHPGRGRVQVDTSVGPSFCPVTAMGVSRLSNEQSWLRVILHQQPSSVLSAGPRSQSMERAVGKTLVLILQDSPHEMVNEMG